MTMPPGVPTLAQIEAASRLMAGAILRTPAIAAPGLAATLGLAGTELVLKLETLHPTGSFKERGALIKLASLDAAERRRGVIAMSAGNHAQGVAFHAGRLGIPATIVMPHGTPFTKVRRTADLGAEVVLKGDSLTEARIAADEIAARRHLIFVHPYDDPLIITGQGTIALELLQPDPGIEVLVVPVGGGGLISGIAIAAKALKPDIEIIGVQAEHFPGMHHILRGLSPPPLEQTIAEGIAVKEPGLLTRQIIQALVDDILLVGEQKLEQAVEMLITASKLVTEGAGAAPVAALMAYPERFRGRKVGLILTGGNIDPRLLSSILMRGMVRAGRLVRLRAEISDTPGALARIARIIGEADGNIVEILHHRLFQDVPVKLAELDVVVETRDPSHVDEIMIRLGEAGFPARLLSNTAIDG